MGLPSFRHSAGIAGNFLILCLDKERKSHIAEGILGRFQNTVIGGDSSHYLNYIIGFHNLSEAEDACEWIKKLEGVSNVRMGIMREVTFVREWLDDQMQRPLKDLRIARS